MTSQHKHDLLRQILECQAAIASARHNNLLSGVTKRDCSRFQAISRKLHDQRRALGLNVPAADMRAIADQVSSIREMLAYATKLDRPAVPGMRRAA